METLSDTRPAAQKNVQAARQRLVLLSNVRLVRADGEAFILAGKTAAVLCLAALGGGMSRAGAAALLWPTASEPVARTNLRVLSHRLYRQHGCALLSGSDRLELDATGLVLAQPTLEEAIDTALNDPSPQWQLLGDLSLDGLSEWTQWLRQQRETMSRRWDEAFSVHVDRCTVKEQWHPALRAAQARLKLSPVSESAHRQVMSLHLQTGDRATALMAYERCREVLSEELGVSPSPLTQALHRQILRMTTTLPTRGEPEPWAFHPPVIVGREQQQLDMNRSWGRQHDIVVCGEGGTGKTRLVREFLRGRSALLVSLRPSDLQLPYAALARILRALPAGLVASLAEPVRQELALVVAEWDSAPAAVADTSSVDEWRLCQAVMPCIAHLVAGGVTALAVEDLHHADARSLQVLIRLLDHAAPNGMRMLFSARPDGPSALLSALLRQVVAEHRADLVRTPPLDGPGVLAMLEGLPLPWLQPSVHAPALYALSGGNPRLVLEILRESARSPHPGQFHGMTCGLKPLLQARVERCSVLARGLLYLALVADAAFCVALAADLMKLPAPLLADPWRELERVGLFNRHGISHDLATRALGDSVPDAVRADMHRQVVAWLKRRT